MINQRQRFLTYLQTCVKSTRATDNNPLLLGGSAPKDYAKFLESERLFDYNPPKWAHISSMYDINEHRVALDIFKKLISDKDFLERDKNDNQGWRRGAISHYVCFLSAQDFFKNQAKSVSNTDGSDVIETSSLKPSISKKEQIPFNLPSLIDSISKTGLLYEENLINRYVCSLMTKPFVILSGLAGSGKTQLALAFARAMSENVEQQLCVVPVGADWTNREPLLGYPNALKQGEYMLPESGALQIMMRALRNPQKPYFLVLDEMNLSYVERYFADFLSALESHQEIPLWEKTDECDSEVPAKISLPKNLFIIGTINVDETTYMFSPKVLDRANVIEFKISDDEMEQFLKLNMNVDVQAADGLCANMGQDFVEMSTKKQTESNEFAQNTLIGFFKVLKKVKSELTNGIFIPGCAVFKYHISEIYNSFLPFAVTVGDIPGLKRALKICRTERCNVL
jgi:hypothetical protein